MQGTQYAPRESILCMEHFVALHCSSPVVHVRMYFNGWISGSDGFVEHQLIWINSTSVFKKG